MNIRQLIKTESIYYDKAIPSDLAEHLDKPFSDLPNEYKYYSNSDSGNLNIFDMSIHHFVRAFLKINGNSDNEIISKIKKIVNM